MLVDVIVYVFRYESEVGIDTQVGQVKGAPTHVCELTQKNLKCFFIVVSGYQCLNMIYAYCDAQNKPAW